MIIKYDLRQKRFLIIGTFVSLVAVVLGISLSMLKIEFIEVIYPLLDIFGVVMFIFCGINALAAEFFLMELKKYGYEIPYDKRVYDSRIDNLPRNHVIYDQMVFVNGKRYMPSMYLMVTYGVIFLLLIFWNIWFHDRWSISSDSGFWILLSLLDLVWLGYAIRFYIQSDNTKYRATAEIDLTRKPRISIGRGIAYIIILGAITFIVKDTIFNMTEYVYKSRVAAEQNFICDIQNSFAAKYEECSDKEKIKTELEKGIELTSPNSIPTGDFYNKVAEGLGMVSIDEVRIKLRIAPDNAKIVVKLENDKIIVTYDNPAKNVELSFKSTGASGERIHVN